MRRSHLLLLALLVPAGCSDDHPTAPAGSPCANPDTISLPDCDVGSDRFSDEACTVLDDAITRGLSTDTARAPSITAPTEDQALPAAAPFTFTWSAPTARRGLPPRRPMTWRDELARWTTLIPEAQAHCAPFSGQAYELRFVIQGQVVLRRQQSLTSYTPDASRWSYLRTQAAGRPIELRIVTARFSNNLVGAGPFVASQPRRFTIAN
ncbi:MAG: hypothetical protein R3A48_12205 [Polyangiales bacterium]